ncbi:FecR family protein [Chitinophaga arvensicola]|uniref:Ferric-dicitrate binding protein FerR, regulates iron transport through sigma-19 n=1 Tax=Chitinophaga arvensicola TaxID=29529 RepID=A0A1I0SDH3_9BACT|nr:hypothetical protein [Chitinophaga arvensicola]SEW56089.1 ferric-dicitrate binding protein FerR, regulates iron transport through sigma-19 [Chitinophaga arvensicola]
MEVKYLAKHTSYSRQYPYMMYQPGPDVRDLISRFIHTPQDPLLQAQIAALREEGPEQAAYVESQLAAWLAEGAPAPLTTVVRELPPPSPVRASRYKWIAAAVAIPVVALLIFLFYSRSGKETSLHYINLTGHTDTLLLAGGSTLIARKDASLSYAAKFAVTPELQLHHGDVWFEIFMPSRVRMKLDEHTDLYTLEAVFAVHKTDAIFKVLLIKGKATLVSDKDKKLLLTPGMMASREQHQALLHKNPKSQALLAWKTGKLKFRNIPLDEIIDGVNSYFDLDIQVPPSAVSLYKRSLTVDFEHSSPEETLALLRKALKAPIVKDSANRYYITLK